jgi:hypothetical protein
MSAEILIKTLRVLVEQAEKNLKASEAISETLPAYKAFCIGYDEGKYDGFRQVLRIAEREVGNTDTPLVQSDR